MLMFSKIISLTFNSRRFEIIQVNKSSLLPCIFDVFLHWEGKGQSYDKHSENGV